MTIKEFELLKIGSEKILDRIYVACYAKVTGVLIYKYRVTREDAEDFFAEAVLKFREKAVREEVEYRNPEAYLMRTAINLFLQTKRQQDRKQSAIEGFQRVQDQDAQLEVFDSVEQEKTEQADAIRAAFLELGEPCHELLTDSILKGIPPRNLAEKYGYKNARVLTVRKGRCKKKLLELFLAKISKTIGDGR